MAKKSTTVAIKYKPNNGVTNLAATSRDGMVFKTSWKLPSNRKDQKNNRRWGNIIRNFGVTTAATYYPSNVYDLSKDVLRNGYSKRNKYKELVSKFVGINTTNSSWSLNRKSYYPFTYTALLDCHFSIFAQNSKGVGPRRNSASYAFTFPPKPSISYDYNDDKGEITFNIKSNASDKSNTRKDERYDTIYWIVVTKFINNKKSTNIVYSGVTSTSHDFKTKVVDIPEAHVLKADDWIEVQCITHNRGVAGDSKENAKSTKVLCQPAIFSIKNITVVGTGANRVISISTNSTQSAHRLVDKVQLQRLKDTEIATVSEANSSSEWSDVSGSVDDAQTKGLTDAYATGKPADGKRTWYRLKTIHDGYEIYSIPVEAKVLYTVPNPAQPVADEYVDFSSIIYDTTYIERYNNVTGETVRIPQLHIEINVYIDTQAAVSDFDFDGVELSYSENRYAWNSNVEPQTIDIPRSKFVLQNSPSVGKYYHYDLYLYDLDIETPYYYKARTYINTTNDTAYGKYFTAGYGSTSLSLYPYALADSQIFQPKNVVLNAPSQIPRGEDIPISWTFESETGIKAWRVYMVHDGATTKSLVASADNTNGKDYDGPLTSTIIPASYVKAEDSAIQLIVQVKNSGGWSGTDVYGELVEPGNAEKTILVADSPVISVESKTIANEQGTYEYTTKITKNAPQLIADHNWLIVKLRAKGSTQERPDGTVVQAPDEVIWSSRFCPTWSIPEDEKLPPTASNILPTDLDLVDGTEYTLEVQFESDLVTGAWSGGLDLWETKEVVTQLPDGSYEVTVTQVPKAGKPPTFEVFETLGQVKSGVVKKDFSVAWTHQAHPVSEDSKAVGVLTPGENDPGKSHISAESMMAKILPVKDVGHWDSDVVDVYRVTPDGAYLIGEGVPFGKVCIDRYAPYSKVADTRYRLCVRTADGDIEWTDIPYSLRYYSIRFDWGVDRSLEIPYNLKITDSFAKDFEARTHLDGKTQGYWNPGAQRTASFDTELIRLSDPEQQALVRELAQYSGPIFVRTPDGAAYQADVQVNNIANSYDSQLLDVSFSVSEVELSEEFKMKASDIMENTKVLARAEQKIDLHEAVPGSPLILDFELQSLSYFSINAEPFVDFTDFYLDAIGRESPMTAIDELFFINPGSNILEYRDDVFYEAVNYAFNWLDFYTGYELSGCYLTLGYTYLTDSI